VEKVVVVKLLLKYLMPITADQPHKMPGCRVVVLSREGQDATGSGTNRKLGTVETGIRIWYLLIFIHLLMALCLYIVQKFLTANISVFFSIIVLMVLVFYRHIPFYIAPLLNIIGKVQK